MTELLTLSRQEQRQFNFDLHVRKYTEMSYIEDKNGYVVWRMGTGGNTELLHLYAYPSLRGHGKALLKGMLKELLRDPPYATVYGFCLGKNESACKFYKAVGFTITFVDGVYAEGGAYVFSGDYKRLKEFHGVS